MDLTTIANWLKTSPLGVIVLGAMGSILAILLLRLVKFLLKTFGLGISRWRKREYDQAWRIGVVTGYLKATEDTTLAIYFMAYHLSRVVVSSLVTLVMFMLFYSLLPSSGPMLRVGTFLAATAFFLAGRWVYEEVRRIRVIYMHEIHPIVEKVRKRKETGEKKSQPTTKSNGQ